MEARIRQKEWTMAATTWARNICYVSAVFLFTFCIILRAEKVCGQCNPDEVLVGEDDRYWYCAKQANQDQVRGVLKDIERRLNEGPQGMLGEEWLFRKKVIEAAGQLLRDHYPTYYGGKIVIRKSDGTLFNICVGDDCSGFTGRGVDCSGFLEYSTCSACIARGFYEASGCILPKGTAADQASIFKQYGAYIPRWGFPDSGDAVFFKDTTGGNTGEITHVAIFIGKTSDGKKMIMNTSYKLAHKRVIFMAVPNNYEEKIDGYGNVSKLFMKISK